jgi:hypothetical protein
MIEGGKRSAWLMHVKKTMKAHKGMKLRDVLKFAKKTYKGGQLLGKQGPMGGSRKKKGGQLYSFAGGPYTDSVLADGAAPFKSLPDATWKGASELTGGQSADTPTQGGRRRRKSRKGRSRRHR